MAVTIKTDELLILLEELNDEREVNINIGKWLEGIMFFFLIGLLGLGTLNPSILKFDIFQVYLWKWVVFGLVIMLGRLASTYIIKFILYILNLGPFYHIGFVFFFNKEKNNLRRFFWSVMIAYGWYYLMYQLIEVETKITESQYVMLSLSALMMISCFAWLMMSILLRLHKIACFMKIYFDEVRKSVLEHCILRMLLSSSPERRDHEISTFNNLSQLNKKDVTADAMDKLMSMVQERSLPSVEVVVTKSILRNFIKLGSSSTHVENIKKFLLEQSALRVNLFEEDEINEKTLHPWVISAYKDRRTLMSDLGKTNTSIEKIHMVARIVVGYFIIIGTGFMYSTLSKK